MRLTNTHIYFWDGLYSQWFPSKFTHNGVTFDNAEQFMMYHKAKLFSDDNVADEILDTEDPRVIKKLGRLIKNFDEEVWNHHKLDIVTRGSYLKFTQNKTLLHDLINDSDKILVEASPYDKIWGIGLHFDDDRVLNETTWQGQNLLGICIMRARKQILKELRLSPSTN